MIPAIESAHMGASHIVAKFSAQTQEASETNIKSGAEAHCGTGRPTGIWGSTRGIDPYAKRGVRRQSRLRRLFETHSGREENVDVPESISTVKHRELQIE